MWKDIESLNCKYQVSKSGKIRNKKTKRILKPQTSKFGYQILTVRPNKNEQINIRIHQIVAETYIGEKPNGYVVNHKDGNKKNNNYKNLEYVTSSENNIHALKKGLRKKASNLKPKRGEESKLHKLTEKEVIKIIEERYKTGFGCRKIAKMLNLPLGAVDGVLSDKRPRWKHINREEIKEKIKKEGKLNGKFS